MSQTNSPKPQRELAAVAVLVVVLLSGLFAWLFLRHEKAAPSGGTIGEQATSQVVTSSATGTLRAATAALAVASVAAAVASAPERSPAVDFANDGLPYMPAGPDAAHPDGPVHPHPITPEHVRISRENHTIQALNDAMDNKDVPALRKTLARYRAEYPEDAQRLQEGYELIANCLEQGAAYRAAAQRYFDEERGSSLRRFVWRHCLGGP